MDIKRILRESKLTANAYDKLRNRKRAWKKKKQFRFHGTFIDRSNGCQSVCILLAGYKSYLYPAIFARLQKFRTDDMDICIVSSGVYSDELNSICEKQGWSYLYTKENNVCLVQNVAISKHPHAQYIFKLDEDIFLTEHYFDNMMRAYKHAQESRYIPGVMAPLIPINGYGHVRILEKLGKLDEFEERFETVKYAAGIFRQIEGNSEVAQFFWGENDVIPGIDEINRRFSEEPLEERPCPIRFSIGAVLFERSLWEDMGYFNASGTGAHMGVDEVELCTYCMIHSRPIMVSENVVVGHLAFGKQNEAMKEYYHKHTELFEI